MNVVPHNRLSHGPEEEAAAARVVRSGRWAAGPELAALESRAAAVARVDHAVGVGSGVAALRLSLLALDVGPGAAVAVPAYSCVALPNAVLACGATVVPVDVQRGTWNICPRALRGARRGRANLKAVIAVHTFGCRAAMEELVAEGLPVIEDCSHAFGTGALGGAGRIAVLSLHATKLIGAGEGGLVLTREGPLADRVRDLRDYADKAPNPARLNDRMTDLEAAIALCQFDRLQRTLARRAELARAYGAALAPRERARRLELPAHADGRVWYRYAIATDCADELVARLAEHGVAAARPVENWRGESIGRTPVAAEAYTRLVSLPLFPSLTREEQARVCAALETVLALPCAA